MCFRKASYKITEDELLRFKSIDNRERAVDGLIQKLILEHELVCNQKERWWLKTREKYRIKEDTVYIDVDTGTIKNK